MMVKASPKVRHLTVSPTVNKHMLGITDGVTGAKYYRVLIRDGQVDGQIRFMH